MLLFVLLTRSRADSPQSRQHSDSAAAQHEPFSAQDHGRYASEHHGQHGQHATRHVAYVPSHHRPGWAEPAQYAVSAFGPYQHREHAHSRIVVSESAMAHHPYAPHRSPHVVVHGSHSGYDPRLSSTVSYPTQQTHHAEVLQSPRVYALDSQGGIVHDIPDIRFPSPMKSRSLMYVVRDPSPRGGDPSHASHAYPPMYSQHHAPTHHRALDYAYADPAMASRSRMSTPHLRPIRNSLGWELWVLKLTAKERNQVISIYQLTDYEATNLKKTARRTKQRESQKRYVLRKRRGVGHTDSILKRNAVPLGLRARKFGYAIRIGGTNSSAVRLRVCLIGQTPQIKIDQW